MGIKLPNINSYMFGKYESEVIVESPSELKWVDAEPDYENPWRFGDKILTNENLDGFVGMVYRITNLIDNRKYIGKKIFTFTNRVKRVGKKRRVVRKKPSDWRQYYGSSESLSRDVELYGSDNFKREVLALCRSKKAMSYVEIHHCFIEKVLETPEFYNTNIMGKFFVKDSSKEIPFDENLLVFGGSLAVSNPNWLKERSEYMKVKENNPNYDPDVKNPRFSGNHHSSVTKEHLRKIHTGRYVSEETKERMAEARRRFWETDEGQRQKLVLIERNKSRAA